MTSTSNPIVIVGAGMAGLRAAVELQKHTCDVLVLEKTERAGGRVKTDRKDGFLLDHGFQIFLTAYPESRSVFNYGDLNLHPFMDGALVRWNGDVHELVDPSSHPDYLIRTMMSDVGTWEDRWLSWKLRWQVTNDWSAVQQGEPERTTMEFLRDYGFSDAYISAFLQPFFSGVFLENQLRTSSSFFRFLYRMFGEGKGALPEQGMQAVPEQLVDRMDEPELRCNADVVDIRPDQVTLRSGESIKAGAVIVAVDGWSGEELGMPGCEQANGTTCFYFSMDEPPLDQPLLMLNGDGNSPITNLCVPSLVCSNYSPPNQHLLSVSTVHDGTDRASSSDVRSTLKSWFGDRVDRWTSLATYDIPHALPARYPEEPSGRSPRLESGTYVAGDFCDTPSLNGALASGRRAAEAVVEDVGLS
jgi:phytoene dehydrogenase-like protein